MCRYLMPFVVILCDHWTQAALSLWMMVGPSVFVSMRPRIRSFQIVEGVFVHSFTEPISASQELRAVNN
jgi:hypothetical protein